MIQLTPVQASEPTIVFSGHPEYPPFMWREGDSIVGVGPDLLRKVGQELGISVEVPYRGNWAEVQEQARTGEIDGLVALYYTEERMEYYKYSIPFSVDPVAIFVHSGMGFPFRSWDTLIGKRGVTTMGDSYGELFDSYAEEHLDLERVETIGECFQKLIDQEADYLVFALYPGLYEAQRHNVAERILPMSPYVTVADWYLAISHRSPFITMIPKIDELIENWVEKGIIEDLIDKHSQDW